MTETGEPSPHLALRPGQATAEEAFRFAEALAHCTGEVNFRRSGARAARVREPAVWPA